ncbi:hypothetical protein OAK17_00795 [Alphaproteobacteria bacterium]|nr:hypothetical protein [Alphaproteobacteria bacterium]
MINFNLKVIMCFILFISPVFSAIELNKNIQQKIKNWQKVGEVNQFIEYYIDTESITKEESFVFVLELINFIGQHRTNVLSGIAYRKIDCSSFAYKTIKLESYNKLFGKGKVLKSHNIAKGWVFPKSGSTGELIAKKACNIAKQMN